MMRLTLGATHLSPPAGIGRIALAIRVRGSVRMLPSVHLDHQTKLTANKVDRVRTDRLLSDEFVPVERTRSKSSPQSGLCLRSGSAQTPGTPGFDLIGSAHVAAPPHPDCFAIRPLPARGERLAAPAIQ
jgi:hypothetical protein